MAQTITWWKDLRIAEVSICQQGLVVENIFSITGILTQMIERSHK